MTERDKLADAIADVNPDLREALDEHLRYYEELLPTLWLSEVAHWCVARYVSNDLEPLADVLAVIERLWVEGSDGDRNTLASGFLEHLPATYQPGGALRSMLGPNLGELYRRLKW